MLNIKVVGTGCKNCLKLEELCNEVVNENKLDATIEKIEDMELFGDLGIFVTPGLIVNEKVLSQGKIPTKSTLKHWLEKLI